MKTNKHISIEDAGSELPFSVPENYFKDFALNIEKQIVEQKKSSVKFIKPWMYIAAMFIGILLIGQVFYTVNKNNTANYSDKYESYVLSQLDETSIMDYYIENPAK